MKEGHQHGSAGAAHIQDRRPSWVWQQGYHKAHMDLAPHLSENLPQWRAM